VQRFQSPTIGESSYKPYPFTFTLPCHCTTTHLSLYTTKPQTTLNLPLYITPSTPHSTIKSAHI
jgi:hypothetical protein